MPQPGTKGAPVQNGKKPKPQLVNRGPAGLLHKAKTVDGTVVPVETVGAPQKTVAKARYRIAPELQHMAVPIDSLTPDPMNARLHPDRNMDAIRTSLDTYGQLKPIVVRRDKSIIVAGNGTYAAAKSLGWDEVAVHWVDLNDIEAAGFGLADNRTAELAKWDFQVVAALDQMLVEAGHPSVGWSDDELEVLRAAEWVPPEPGDEGFDSIKKKALQIEVGEWEVIEVAVLRLREREGKKDMTEGACLKVIADEWLMTPSMGIRDAGTEEEQEDEQPLGDDEHRPR